jgi:hypothetical protein
VKSKGYYYVKPKEYYYYTFALFYNYSSYRPSGGLCAVVAFVVIVEAASSRLKAW